MKKAYHHVGIYLLSGASVVREYCVWLTRVLHFHDLN